MYNPRLSLTEIHSLEMLNNSITESTVKDSAHPIQSHHPELTKVLLNVGQCAGLVPSSTVRVASMKDVLIPYMHLREARRLSNEEPCLDYCAYLSDNLFGRPQHSVVDKINIRNDLDRS